LIDRIATDAPGYSGFFSAVSIGHDELEKIYAFDEAMIRYVDQISGLLDELSRAVTAREGVQAVISRLDALMLEANSAYDLREDVLKGIA
jgi:hypothetical protein